MTRAIRHPATGHNVNDEVVSSELLIAIQLPHQSTAPPFTGLLVSSNSFRNGISSQIPNVPRLEGDLETSIAASTPPRKDSESIEDRKSADGEV